MNESKNKIRGYDSYAHENYIIKYFNPTLTRKGKEVKRFYL